MRPYYSEDGITIYQTVKLFAFHAIARLKRLAGLSTGTVGNHPSEIAAKRLAQGALELTA